MRYRSRILLILFCSFSLLGMAQTVIKIPFNQPSQFIVKPEVVSTSFAGNAILEIGNQTSYSGGSGTYTYSWYFNEDILGYDSLLMITQNGAYVLAVSDGNGCELSSTYLIDTTLSVSTNQLANVKLFPNPANEVFNIQSTDLKKLKKVEIFNSEGKMIKTFKLDLFFESRAEFNVSSLTQGMYLVIAHFENGQFANLLVKN